MLAKSLILALILTLIPIAAHAEQGCRPNPLAGIQQGRWTIVKPCFTATGYVNGYATSSNGAYWLSLMADDGRNYSAKVYPQDGIQRPEAFETVIVTGALVTEVSDGGLLPAPILWTEIVPVWRLERPGVVRQYNEQRADGWYQVTLMRDGWWYGRKIEPEGYAAAGIRR